MPRTPFEIQPGSGCPGGVVDKGPRAGLTQPMCVTCSRLGGRDLQPAVSITRGFVECCNFLALGGHGRTVAADGAPAQAVGRGGGCVSSTPMGEGV